MNRKILITGVGLALGLTRSEIMVKVRKGEIPVLVYDTQGLELIEYTPRESGRYPLLYVEEQSIKGIVNPLPAPAYPQPEGNLILKEGAAAILGRSSDWFRDLASGIRRSKGDIPPRLDAWVYDPEGINFIPLKENVSTDRNARVLHFRKEDVIAYKERLEAKLTSPGHPKRIRKMPELTEAQKRQAVSLAQAQLEANGFVVIDQIRKTMNLNTLYADPLRKLRELHKWPLKFPTQSEATRKRLA